MVKPTADQMKGFQEHIGWRYIKEWIDGRIEDIKNRILIEKDIDIIKKLQTEYEVYQSILVKVKKP